jgi:GntR family transcriptional regulator
MLLEKKLDKKIPVPLYYQLKELILAEIKKGNYKCEDLIPTENEISEVFEISRTTVRQAITELVSEGWLYRVKSKGTYVSYPKLGQDFITKIEPFDDQITRLGMRPSTEVLEFKVDEATEEVAKNLEILEGDKVIYLQRRRFADDAPLVVLETYLPYEKCYFLMDYDFVKDSLYKALADRGGEYHVTKIRRIVEVAEANAEDVAYLNMKKGKPIQFFSSVGYNALNKPIEYSLARYRGDRSRFEVIVTPE